MLTEIEGLTVRYETMGEGSPVVLLHGWGAASDTLRPVVHCLAGDHRVLAVDLPGFGQSAMPPGTWGSADYARHVARFMDASGCPRAAVLGHSFGGRVAICLAAMEPERVDRLVLVDSAGIIPARSWRYHARVRAFKVARRALQAVPVAAWRDALLRRLTAGLGSADYRDAGPMRPILVRIVNEDLQPLLPSVRTPALLIWGENDLDVPVSDAKIMAAALPDARLEVLAGAGHYAYMDRLPQFCRLVRDFLRDV